MPQTLTIGTTPHSQWQQLQPLLNHLGWSQQPQDPETWYQSADATLTGPSLLLHTRPELAVAHALDAGNTPEQALSAWQTAAERLLATYKRNRRQAAMADAAAVAQHPGKLVAWLKSNHPAFYNISGAIELPAGEPAAPSNLNLLIATQLVAQTPALNSLLAQLEASSIPVADDHYPKPDVDILAIHEEVNEQSEQAQQHVETVSSECQALEAQLKQLKSVQTHLEVQLHKAESDQKALQDENTLLLEQLHKVQEELETYYHKNKDGEQSSQSLKVDNDNLKAQAEQLKTDLQRAQNQLAQSQSALDTANNQLSKAQADLKVATERQEKSSSIKVAQVEKARKTVEQECEDFKAENDLILKQLFKVQEELERYYLENQSLKQADAEAQKIRKNFRRAERDLARIRPQRDRFRDESRRLRAEVQRLNELNEREGFARRQLQRKIKNIQQAIEASQGKPARSTLRALARPLKTLSRSHRAIAKHIKLVQASEYFDQAWYRDNYPDAAVLYANLAEHYVRHGGYEGRDPGPNFSSKAYLNAYPDVAQAGFNPLVHYLLHGKADGRKIPK